MWCVEWFNGRDWERGAAYATEQAAMSQALRYKLAGMRVRVVQA